MSYIVIVILTSLLLNSIETCLSLAIADDKPTDLEIYLDEIRQDAIAESARSTLLGIAPLFNGTGLVRLSKDSRGQYWTEVHVRGPCSGEEEVVKRHRASQDSLINRLKPIVDENRSGFVSTEEAKSFRQIIEFGQFCIQMAEPGTPYTEVTVNGVAVSEETARAQLIRYRDYRRRCLQLGLSLLDLPEESHK